jgi:hypothetical protein
VIVELDAALAEVERLRTFERLYHVSPHSEQLGRCPLCRTVPVPGDGHRLTRWPSGRPELQCPSWVGGLRVGAFEALGITFTAKPDVQPRGLGDGRQGSQGAPARPRSFTGVALMLTPSSAEAPTSALATSRRTRRGSATFDHPLARPPARLLWARWSRHSRRTACVRFRGRRPTS